jgi:hypothetical protein
MSREFGEYQAVGYFHTKINNALDDLHEAHSDLHRKLIPFFESLYEVCYEVSNVEAGDSGEYASINSLKQNIPKMIEILKDIEKDLENVNEEE